MRFTQGSRLDRFSGCREIDNTIPSINNYSHYDVHLECMYSSGYSSRCAVVKRYTYVVSGCRLARVYKRSNDQLCYLDVNIEKGTSSKWPSVQFGWAGDVNGLHGEIFSEAANKTTKFHFSYYAQLLHCVFFGEPRSLNKRTKYCRFHKGLLIFLSSTRTVGKKKVQARIPICLLYLSKLYQPLP